VGGWGDIVAAGKEARRGERRVEGCGGSMGAGMVKWKLW
jgi:hypothetical protein